MLIETDEFIDFMMDLPQSATIKDKEGIYKHVNPESLEHLKGVTTSDEVVGKTIDGICAHSNGQSFANIIGTNLVINAKSADYHVINDGQKQVLKNQWMYNILGELQCENIAKIPIKLSESGKVSAIFSLSTQLNINYNDLFNAYLNTARNSKIAINKFSRHTGLDQYLDAYDKLTTQEINVLLALAKYGTRADTAQNLTLSPNTLDRHTDNIKSKMINSEDFNRLVVSLRQ